MSTTPTTKHGFTLIETMVAIAIILIVLVAPFEGVEKAFGAATAARDELIGTSLAEEGIEAVREIRADNYLKASQSGVPRSWLDGLDGTAPGPNCFAPNLCTVDLNPQRASPITVCYDGVNVNDCTTSPLYLTSAGLYIQSHQGVATRFYRTIQLSTIPNTDSGTEVKLTVTVTWNTNHTAYNTVLTEYLNNWL